MKNDKIKKCLIAGYDMNIISQEELNEYWNYITNLQEERDYLYNKLSFEIEQLCKVIEQTNKDIYIEERYDSED